LFFCGFDYTGLDLGLGFGLGLARLGLGLCLGLNLGLTVLWIVDRGITYNVFMQFKLNLDLLLIHVTYLRLQYFYSLEYSPYLFVV